MSTRRVGELLVLSLFVRVAVALGVLAPCARLCAQSRSDGALGALFAESRASVDPDLARLRELYAELAARVTAERGESTALSDAERAIVEAEQLVATGGEPSRLARKKQLAWAALSLVDRQLALAAERAALVRVKARARAEGAAAERSRAARREAAAALERLEAGGAVVGSGGRAP